MNRRRYIAVALIAAGIIGTHAGAEEKAPAHVLSPVTVIGSKENVRTLPGAGDYIDLQDIRGQGYDDINRVLRRVPGVYVREEDGFGLFPNISLRGVDPGRSSKVTIMEDGIPTAPAPYAGSAAYYAPTVARMSGIEVLKGSSQIKYGPHTSGGVINYLSTPIPTERAGYARTLYGTDNEIRNHVYYGDTLETGAGRIGYLIEYYDRRTDGFKEIDATADFPRGDRTGFIKREPMLKLSWEPNTDRYQRFEFKIGHTEMDADETYMGLADDDFTRDPYRRYAGSRFDNISTRQTRTYLRHHIEWTPELRLTTTAYYNEFKRNWFKDRSTGADLGDPGRLAVLKGEAAGELNYRNNNRDYYSAGIETLVNYTFETGEFTHDLDVGVRLHQDQAKRFQRDDTFVQAANGTITDRSNGVPGGGGNREENAEAVAVFVQDAVQYGRWTFVPGIRYEHVRFDYKDFDTAGSPGLLTGEGDSTLDIVAPGLGLIFDLAEEAQLFGGIYRGFSTPDPRANAKDSIEEETSIGYEIGARYNDRRAFNSELVFFYTDFSDLIVPDIIGIGGGTSTENVGDVIAYGAEFKTGYDLGVAHDWPVRNPWYATLTWTRAELDSDATTADEESIFSGGRKGNKVPYIPEVQFLVGTGLETDRWGAFVDVIYVDSAYTTASNVNAPFDPEGAPNASYGKTDDHVVVDVSGFIRLKPNVKLIGSVHNAFDEEYIASRHPAGPRPGKALTALAGLEITF